MADKLKKLFLRKCDAWEDFTWAVRYKDDDGEEINYAVFSTRQDARKFLRIKLTGYRRVTRGIKMFEESFSDIETITTFGWIVIFLFPLILGYICCRVGECNRNIENAEKWAITEKEEK